MPIEYGAEFIHGVPGETFTIVRRAGLTAVELTGDYYAFRKGRLSPDTSFQDDWQEVVDRMGRYARPDRSFMEFLKACCTGARWKSVADPAIGYVEGFHAAHIDRISLRSLYRAERAQSAIRSDRQFRLLSGYDALVRHLVSGIDPARSSIHLNTIVGSVRWRRGQVRMLAHNATGEPLPEFRARAAIVTLPLGVLQAPPGTPGMVRFDPSLPSVARLGVANVVKIMVRFRQRFWEGPIRSAGGTDLTRLGFLLSRDPYIPTWWTTFPVQAPVLTGWSGGSAADRLAGLSGTTILRKGLESLARMLGMDRSSLGRLVEGWYYHDWLADPYSLGAYSYVMVGGTDEQRRLARPLEGTIFIAGEATNSEGHSGTIHGAMSTGFRAARLFMQHAGKGARPAAKRAG